jgi:hypothetical protein
MARTRSHTPSRVGRGQQSGLLAKASWRPPVRARKAGQPAASPETGRVGFLPPEAIPPAGERVTDDALERANAIYEQWKAGVEKVAGSFKGLADAVTAFGNATTKNAFEMKVSQVTFLDEFAGEPVRDVQGVELVDGPYAWVRINIWGDIRTDAQGHSHCTFMMDRIAGLVVRPRRMQYINLSYQGPHPVTGERGLYIKMRLDLPEVDIAALMLQGVDLQVLTAPPRGA